MKKLTTHDISACDPMTNGKTCLLELTVLNPTTVKAFLDDPFTKTVLMGTVDQGKSTLRLKFTFNEASNTLTIDRARAPHTIAQRADRNLFHAVNQFVYYFNDEYNEVDLTCAASIRETLQDRDVGHLNEEHITRAIALLNPAGVSPSEPRAGEDSDEEKTYSPG
jgi:hypothetical protein